MSQELQLFQTFEGSEMPMSLDDQTRLREINDYFRGRGHKDIYTVIVTGEIDFGYLNTLGVDVHKCELEESGYLFTWRDSLGRTHIIGNTPPEMMRAEANRVKKPLTNEVVSTKLFNLPREYVARAVRHRLRSVRDTTTSCEKEVLTTDGNGFNPSNAQALRELDIKSSPELIARILEVPAGIIEGTLAAVRNRVRYINYYLSQLGNVVMLSASPYASAEELGNHPYIPTIAHVLGNHLLNVTPNLVNWVNAFGRDTILVPYFNIIGEEARPIVLDDFEGEHAETLRGLVVKSMTTAGEHTHIGLNNVGTEQNPLYDVNLAVFRGIATLGINLMERAGTFSGLAINGYLPGKFLDIRGYLRPTILSTGAGQHPYTLPYTEAGVQAITYQLSLHPATERAMIPGGHAHATDRIKAFGTNEDMSSDQMPHEEQEIAKMMFGNLKGFMLAHLYALGPIEFTHKYGITMQDMKRFYTISDNWIDDPEDEQNIELNPEERKYAILRDTANNNRILVYGLEAEVIDGNNNEVALTELIKAESELIKKFFSKFAEEENRAAIDFEDLEWVTLRFEKMFTIPIEEQRSVALFFNAESDSYGVGNFQMHMYADVRRILAALAEGSDYVYDLPDGSNITFTQNDLEEGDTAAIALDALHSGENVYIPKLIAKFVDGVVHPIQNSHWREQYRTTA